MAAAFAGLALLGLGAIIVLAILGNDDIRHGIEAAIGEAREAVIAGITEARQDIETFLADVSLRAANIKLVLNPADAAAQQEKFSAEGVIQAGIITDQFETALNSYLDGSAVNFNMDGLEYVMSGDAGLDAQAAFVRYFSADGQMFEALEIAANTEDWALDVLVPVAIDFMTTTMPGISPGEILNQVVHKTGIDPMQLAHEFEVYYADNPVAIDELIVAVGLIQARIDENTVVDTTGVTSGVGTTAASGSVPLVDVPVDAKLVTENMTAATQAWADDMVAAMPAAVTLAVTEANGDMTVAATSMTQPFVDAFTTSFSPEGTVTSIWSTFLTGFTTGVVQLGTTVASTMPTIQNATIAAFGNIIGVVNNADSTLRRMLNTLHALTAAPFRVVIDIQTNGSMPAFAGATPNGSHAGGLDNVPFDNYLANLHQGEMVLTREEAEGYRAGNALPGRQSEVSIDNSSPTVIINGVQNFDEFLREASRRGLSFDKYRR
jgi:hypothetical protein